MFYLIHKTLNDYASQVDLTGKPIQAYLSGLPDSEWLGPYAVRDNNPANLTG
jgi:hypothetical protein